ncbi:potassium transporter TrkG [Spiroplasma endosymbiont of Panorpa germanica]|uniref:potassium transporter TrkG n=1 Tax=Spiroplasma endosymbiont of Panorpa germanica TaxID=3066314 RepID=UPI0030D17DC5
MLHLIEIDDEKMDKTSDSESQVNNPAVKKKKRFKESRHERIQKRRKSFSGDDEDKKTFFAKLKNWWPLSKVSGKILLIYLLTVLAGGILLIIPGVVINQSFHWDFLTGIFTASSAFSDTGITISNAAQDYSFWGQLLILIMIQIGGIGILTFKIVLLISLGKKISIDDQSVAQSERGSSQLSNTVEMIKDGFIFLTFVEIFGVVFLFFGFYFTPLEFNEYSQIYKDGNIPDFQNPYHSFEKSIWFAVFHSVSAVNNAGFDIISGSSLQPYNLADNHGYLIQSVILIQWVIGGLGYPTFHDIKQKIKGRREGRIVKWSLFTKLNFTVYLSLFILGPLLVLFSELSQGKSSYVLNYYSVKIDKEFYDVISAYEYIGPKPFGQALMDIFFNVTSSRNAGFSSIDINQFNAGSKLIMSVWMFIGSAPSSTAGGIRTTTFAIVTLAIIGIIRNRKSVFAYRKKIPEETVRRSFAVFIVGVMVIVVSTAVIYIDSNKVLSNQHDGDKTIIELITLICSAFGTVGLNPFTSGQMLNLGAISKITLVLIMFTGQLGISNTLLAFIKHNNTKSYDYLEEEVVIG